MGSPGVIEVIWKTIQQTAGHVFERVAINPGGNSMRKTCVKLMILILIVASAGCTGYREDIVFKPEIMRRPEPQNLAGLHAHPLTELPEFNPAARSKPDLRSRDLTQLNLSSAQALLMNASFNTHTRWPDTLPDGFNPQNILAVNQNPGLQIRSLHDIGITGQGVGVAILDYTLLTDHAEYGDNLMMYAEVNMDNGNADFHGCSMASLLVGQSLGVAPDAALYFVAVKNYDSGKNDLIHNQAYTAQALRGIIHLNETLQEADRIRVVSISQWWSPHTKGYRDMVRAVAEAKKAGIFVVSCNLWQFDPAFHIHGLMKEVLADPDDWTAYQPASWAHWIEAINRNGHGDFYESELRTNGERKVLLVPSGNITAAGAEHALDYAFNPTVNWSSTIPYVAGLYALACQVYPPISPETFWDTAYNTGIACATDGPHADARIVDPVAMMKVFQSMKD